MLIELFIIQAVCLRCHTLPRAENYFLYMFTCGRTCKNTLKMVNYHVQFTHIQDISIYVTCVIVNQRGGDTVNILFLAMTRCLKSLRNLQRSISALVSSSARVRREKSQSPRFCGMPSSKCSQQWRLSARLYVSVQF